MQTQKKGTLFALDDSGFKERFFQAGPTYLFGVLGSVDDRISGLHEQVQSKSPACASQEPVAFTLTPPGGDVTLYAQCYESFDTRDFVQWAVKDGKFYLYSYVGGGRVAAVATPNDSNTVHPNAYSVHLWLSFGDGSGDGQWDHGSYGVVELTADPNASAFEMAVAGLGLGYCGAQLKSDGSVLYAKGSTDMGSTCNDTDSLCVSASDATTPATCAPAQQAFGLTSLGRLLAQGSGTAPQNSGAWGASAYPGGAANNVTLNGAATDSLHFGPSAPTPGAATLT